MYRVMIIDDEPLILAGVISMVNWEEYGCKIVGKASNGSQALEKIVDICPDIIITDIKMPTMDGITFIKKVKEQGIDCTFVLLTNLEDFNMAKEAIMLGAVDYLVKLELTEEALIQSIKKAIEACDNVQRLKNNRKFKQVSIEDEIKNYFQKVLLNEAIDIEENIVDEVKEKFDKPVVMMINFNYKYVGFTIDCIQNDQKKILDYAKDILEDMVNRFFKYKCIFQWEQNSIILIVSQKDMTIWKEEVRIMSEKMILVLKDYFEIDMVVSISEQEENVDEIPKLFNQVVCGINYYYYNSENKIIFYSKELDQKETHIDNLNFYFIKKDLLMAVRQNDSNRFLELINQIIFMLRKNMPTKKQVINICSNLYCLIISFYEEDENIKFPYVVNIINELNSFATFEEILKWILGFGNYITEILSNKKATKSDKIIELVNGYVEEHYKEKITLGEVAEELNLSQGYLSSIFKKLTGNTFTDYVSEIKIEKAKKMIETHNYLIYEISDSLGFDNPYYFSRVFKKITGYTPKEWEHG